MESNSCKRNILFYTLGSRTNKKWNFVLMTCEKNLYSILFIYLFIIYFLRPKQCKVSLMIVFTKLQKLLTKPQRMTPCLVQSPFEYIFCFISYILALHILVLKMYKKFSFQSYQDRLQSQNIYLDFLDEPTDSIRRRREGTYVSYSYGPPGKRVKVCQFYSYGSFQFDGYFIKFNPLTARIFTVFGHSLLEGRVMKLLGVHLSVQVHKKVKFS